MATGNRRYRRPLWKRTVAWIVRIVLSPPVILYSAICGQRRIAASWVRGFLLFGFLLLSSLGLVLWRGNVSAREVFEALDSFDVEPVAVSSDRPYADEINAAASRYGLNPLAVSFVIQIESGYQPDLVSPKGACGLMQIMPETWRSLNPDSPCKGDHAPPICAAGDECIFSPWANIRTGSLYLSRLLEANGGDYLAALQAYNAGQQNVSSKAQAKYRETRGYIASFLSLFTEVQQDAMHDRLSSYLRFRHLLPALLITAFIYMATMVAFFWHRHRWAS